MATLIEPSIKIGGMDTLGDRVKAAREWAGLSQQDLADKVGIKQPTIAGLEKGASKGSKHIVQIAIACGVSPTWLATGKGTKAA